VLLDLDSIMILPDSELLRLEFEFYGQKRLFSSLRSQERISYNHTFEASAKRPAEW
jgi:hypothetical protein